LLFLFLILPFVREKKPKKEKPMPPDVGLANDAEDPWEKELRRRRETTTRK
jgi:hypothetical protein